MSKRSEKNPIDAHVGSRIKMRRMMIGMSQSGLGDALGLTFQQVQKYEKGTNRVGASRLQHLSEVLQVSVSFFFEGLIEESSAEQKDMFPIQDFNQFFATRDGLDLARAFMKIDNIELRRRIVALVEDLVE
jgi:transcriptional regulator with XRE-family HTH domain